MVANADIFWRLRQLTELGLSQNLLVAAYLSELHKLVPSHANSFLWVDKQGHIFNLYDERIPHHLLKELSYFLQHADLASLDFLRVWIQEFSKPKDLSIEKSPTKFIHHLYLRCFRKANYHKNLALPVYASNNKKLGVLLCHRQLADKRFSSKEVSRLTESAKILSSGLNSIPQTNQLMTDGYEQGLILVDKHGAIQNLCSSAQKLVLLSSQNPGSRPLESTHHFDLRSFRGLDDFIDALIDQQNSDINLADLSLSRVNQWGEFKLTGTVVHDTIGKRAPQICLTIKWQIPFSLNIFNKIEQLNLTPRQETIALLYAVGHQTKSMANMLNLSLYTVKEHVQNIFERLQIHSRAELIERIVCEEKVS